MQVYFLRHGETELNRQNIVQGSGLDSELNEIGQAQARAFFEAYHQIPFELVVTSKLRRTHQTVQHFLDRQINWHQTPDLNEISWGALEGAPPSEERHQAFHEVITAWRKGNVDVAFPGGESARQLDVRVGRFLNWLRERQEKHILVATHGRTLRVLIAQLKGLPLSSMDKVGHTNTGCYMARFADDQVHFELENDVTHLKMAGLEYIRSY